MIPESDSYYRTVKEMRRNPLTREREVVLGVLIQEGDQDAANELVEANMRIAVSEAHKFAAKSTVPLDDIVSAAFYGLVDAAWKFDPDKGNRFITYAIWHIRRRMNMEIETLKAPVKLPHDLNQGLKPVNEFYARPENLGRGVRQADAREISNGSPIGYYQILAATTLIAKEKRLDSDCHDSNDTAKDRITSWSPSPDQGIELSSRRALVEEMLASLPDKQAVAIKAIFLDGCTLQQAGDRMGYCHEAARLLAKRGLASLKKRYGDTVALELA
jgi:RNA polymerase primary sigma factor